MIDQPPLPKSFSCFSFLIFPHLPGDGCKIWSERPSSSFLFLPPLAKHHLAARECSETPRTSAVALLDCICRLLIAVRLVWLLQCEQICGPRRACTSRDLLWASPDFDTSKITAGITGLWRLENRCGPHRTFTARKSLWTSPDFYGSKIAAGLARLFVPDRMPERMPDTMPCRMPDRMPEYMSDKVPDRMSENMSDRMQESMSDRYVR